MSGAWRRALPWVRTLHIYLSIPGVVAMLFFATTGFLMNHEDFFGLESTATRSTQHAIPQETAAKADPIETVAALRRASSVRGNTSSFEVEESEIRVSLRAPGRRDDATIDRATGRVELSHERHGLLGALSDLHKGESTGTPWRRIMDATAILLAASATSGMILLVSTATRRRIRLVLLLAGATLVAIVGCTALFS